MVAPGESTHSSGIALVASKQRLDALVRTSCDTRMDNNHHKARLNGREVLVHVQSHAGSMTAEQAIPKPQAELARAGKARLSQLRGWGTANQGRETTSWRDKYRAGSCCLTGLAFFKNPKFWRGGDFKISTQCRFWVTQRIWTSMLTKSSRFK